MSVNSTSLNNASHPLSAFNFALECYNTKTGTVILITFTITSYFLVVPLCVFVLYLGHQRSKLQGSKTSRSDFLTQHTVAVELLSVIGTTMVCCGVYADLPHMMIIGLYLFSLNMSGQMFFHILTCLEHYLAVVQPITYLSLSKAKATRSRNITVCCVWLLNFVLACVLLVAGQVAISIVSFCITTLFLIIIAFCSLSVLCVLTRSGPGAGGRDRQRVDPSKMRAFYTITAILGVLLIRFGGNMFSTVLFFSMKSGERGVCGVWLSALWFYLPSSLVLPLLFLQRAGKLPAATCPMCP